MTTPSPERITTQEAARRLGKSPSQVRRLVASGKLRGETEQRPQGSRLWVLWDSAPHDPSTTHDAAYEASHEASPRTVPREDYEWLQARLERSEEAQAELRRLLLASHQTIENLRRLLPAGNDASTTHDEPGEASPTMHDAPSRPAARPWWKVWGR